MKPVVVYSFPRSGTHFLINTIALNFGFTTNQVINIPRDASIADYNLDQQTIRKSHQESHCSGLDSYRDNYHAFYIWRDPRAVVTSLFKYHELAPELDPYDSIHALLEHDNVAEFNKTFIDAWTDHVMGWRRYGVHVVTYEDLHTDFEATATKIAGVIGVPMPESLIRPTREHLNVVYWRGALDSWKEYLTTEQAEMIHDVMCDLNKELYDDS